MLCKRFKECTKRKWPYRAVCKLDKSIRFITANVGKTARGKCQATMREETHKITRLLRLREELLAPVRIRISAAKKAASEAVAAEAEREDKGALAAALRLAAGGELFADDEFGDADDEEEEDAEEDNPDEDEARIEAELAACNDLLPLPIMENPAMAEKKDPAGAVMEEDGLDADDDTFEPHAQLSVAKKMIHSSRRGKKSRAIKKPIAHGRKKTPLSLPFPPVEDLSAGEDKMDVCPPAAQDEEVVTLLALLSSPSKPAL